MRESTSLPRQLFGSEDWRAVWNGVAIVIAALVLYVSGSSIKWLAIAPKKRSTLPDIIGRLSTHALQYAALFVAWAVLLGVGARGIGLRLAHFLPSFALPFIFTIPIFSLGFWDQAARYGLEPPVVALNAGLAIAPPEIRTAAGARGSTRGANARVERGSLLTLLLLECEKN